MSRSSRSPWVSARLLVPLALMHALGAHAAAPAPSSAAAAPPWETRFFDAPAKEVLEAAQRVTVADGAGAVLLLEERVVSFEADGRARYRYRSVYRVITASSVRLWSQIQAAWDPWRQSKPNLRARVITKDGRVHLLDPKTIEVSGPEARGEDLYTDTRSLRAPLPAVAPGAVVEQEITQDSGPPLAGAGVTERWYQGSSVPLIRSRLVLEAPRALPLHIVQHPKTQPAPARSEDGSRVRLVFEAGPVDALTDLEPGAPEDPPPLAYVGYSTGASWRDVATRYARVVEDQISGAEMGATVAELKRGVKDSAALIARLVARMHRDVRYSGVEFGDAAVVPRRPREVLDRRYGDCKDKAAFLVAMLRAAGVRAHVALLRVGTGDVDADLPGLGRFNHAIVYIPGARPLWIDPTDEYSPVGELPLGDQGRLALVADARTTALLRTPAAPGRANSVVERRELQLQESGGARVVERTEAVGSPGWFYRAEYASTDRKKIEEQLTRYVKSQYGAKALTRFEHGDPRDVSKPFWLEVQASDAELAVIDADNARVFLRMQPLFERLPGTLRRPAEAEGREAQEPAKKRRTDFVMDDPYVYELRYHIVPPHGFAPAPPPPNETRALGTATLSLTYATTRAGAVDATLRFDSGKTRLSPDEVEALQVALKKLYGSDAPVIVFKQLGEASLAAGRVREALAEFRRLDAAHPGQALHATQIALALLRAGLGDEARRHARRAVEVDAKSGLAHRVLGWVLQHDLLGRRFKPGIDHAGAEAAYRKALALDPKDHVARGLLAVLLEHDGSGTRSHPPARLDELGRLFRELREADVHGYEANELLALLYRERFDEVVTTARAMSNLRRDAHGVVLAAIGARRGAATALKEAAARVASPDDRREAIRVAAAELMRLRRYPEASTLFIEAARGASNAAELRQLAAHLARTRRRETVKLDSRSPEAVLKGFISSLLATPDDAKVDPLAIVRPYAAPELAAELGGPEAQRAFWKGFRAGLGRSQELPGAVLADMFLSADLKVDGDAATGYRVRVLSPSSPGDEGFYLVARPEGPRVLGHGTIPFVGMEALRLVSAGKLAAAARWLDWAVEGEQLGTADDPLSGSILARLWTKGAAKPDQARVERAAWSLVARGPTPERALAPLEKCRTEASAEPERIGCELALLAGAGRLKRHDQLLAVSGSLIERYPMAPTAVFFRIMALVESGRYADARKVGEPALKKMPELGRLRAMLQDVLTRLGDFAGAERLAREHAESPAREPADFNQLAWIALARGDTGDKTLETARRAVELEGRRDSASLHTLASVLAERDAPEEAFEVLIEMLDKRGDDAPTPEDWYVVGRIAEGYGVTDAALAAYARVEKPATPEPLAVWTLAERRAKKLRPAQAGR